MNSEIELSAVITDIAAGPFGSNLKVSCFVPVGFPIIDGANLKGLKVTDNLTKFVTEEKARSLSRSIARRGDIVVTISGTLGQIAYIPDDSLFEEYLCSQRQFKVTFNTSKVYVPYLVFYFHTREGQSKILAFANQTGVPALAQPTKNFKKIRLSLPPLEQQRKIALIAELLTSKIEANTKLNGYLEEWGQGLLEKYQESCATTIPLSNVMDFGNGYAFKSGAYIQDGLYKVLTIKNVQDGSVDCSMSNRIDELPPKMKPFCKLQPGDVVLSLTGNVGRVGIVPEENCLLNQRVAVLQPYNYALLPGLYFHFRQKAFQNKMIGIAKGTAQANLSPVETLKLEMPYNESFFEISQKLKPAFDLILANTIESKRLAVLRDALLPKLMSGEIDVSKIDLTQPNSHLA